MLGSAQDNEKHHWNTNHHLLDKKCKILKKEKGINLLFSCLTKFSTETEYLKLNKSL